MMPANVSIVDLQTGSALKLPSIYTKSIIGLSTDDVLLCVTEESLDLSEIVVELCHVIHQPDGYWLIASPYLPTTVNDDVIRGHVLLSQGSVICVGDRKMHFTSDSEVIKTGNPQLPPPKPMRSSQDKLLEAAKDGSLSASCAFDPSMLLRSMTSENADNQHIPTPDTELLQFLDTKDGLAHMTAAIVCHHLSLYTSLQLSQADTECIFRSFEHVSAWEEKCFQTFLAEYEQVFSDKKRNRVSPDILNGSGSPCIHAPVLHLLTDLLRLTLDPIEYNILWMKVLSVLCMSSKALIPLVFYKTPATVLGCMAARADIASLQQYGCHILARVAQYKPAHGEKGPIREGGIQLLVQTILQHGNDVKVLRPALKCLGNLTLTFATLAMETVNSMEFQSLEAQRDNLVRIMGVLDFIEETAVPHLQILASQPTTHPSLLNSISGILTYFQEGQNNISISHKDEIIEDEEDAGMVEEDVQDLLNKHFNQTTEISQTIAEIHSHNIPHHNHFQPDTIHSSMNLYDTRLDSVPDTYEDEEPTHTDVDNNEDCVTNIDDVELSDMEDYDEEPTETPDVHPSIIHGVEFFSDEEDDEDVKQKIQQMNILKRNAEQSSKSTSSLKGNKTGTLRKSVAFSLDRIEIFGDDSADDKESPNEDNQLPLEENPVSSKNEVSGENEKRDRITAAGQQLGLAKPGTRVLNFETRKKKTTGVDIKKPKPKKKFSILSTEYRQKPKPKENVALQKSNLLFGAIEKPEYHSLSIESEKRDKTPPEEIIETAYSARSGSNMYEHNETNKNRLKPGKQISRMKHTDFTDVDLRDEEDSIGSHDSIGSGSNTSRFFRIFGKMSKKNSQKFNKTDKDTHSLDSGDSNKEPNAKKSKGQGSPSELIADFVRKTRKLFKDGSGKYDIAEAAVRVSLAEESCSGLSYQLVSSEERVANALLY